MDLKNAKILGGVGAILMFGILFKRFGSFLTIVGVILTLIALKEISDKFKKPEIFSNYLVAFILHIVSTLLIIFSAVSAILSLAFIFSFRWGFHLGIGTIILLLFVYAIMVVSGYFVKKSFEGVADATGVSYFRTAGLLIFIGAILLILFLLGGIVALVGYVFEIVAFFSLPDQINPVQENISS